MFYLDVQRPILALREASAATVRLRMSAVIEGDEEQLAALHLVEEGTRVTALTDGVAERRREPIEHRDVEEEVADLGFEPVEHLRHQVVRQQSVVTGELVDQRLRIAPAPQRHGHRSAPADAAAPPDRARHPDR